MTNFFDMATITEKFTELLHKVFPKLASTIAISPVALKHYQKSSQSILCCTRKRNK